MKLLMHLLEEYDYPVDASFNALEEVAECLENDTAGDAEGTAIRELSKLVQHDGDTCPSHQLEDFWMFDSDQAAYTYNVSDASNVLAALKILLGPASSQPIKHESMLI